MLIIGALGIGCVPDDLDDLEYFEVHNSEGESRLSLLVPTQSVGADPARLDGFAGDIVSVEYSIGSQWRPFLLERNLATGIMSGDSEVLTRCAMPRVS